MSGKPNQTMTVNRAQFKLAADPAGSVDAGGGSGPFGRPFSDAADDGTLHDLWRSLAAALIAAVVIVVIWLLARGFAAMALNDLWRLSHPAVS